MGAGLIVQLAALVAAVLGIYFAEKKPYTHIAAGAVGIATIAGIFLTIESDRDAAFTRQTLSNLARSVPPSFAWRERVRQAVQDAAATRDYHLYQVVYDKADFHDPDATAIHFFRSSSPAAGGPTGLLVVSPTTYSELSVLDKPDFEAEIQAMVLGRRQPSRASDAASIEALSDHVGDVACALYATSRIGQGFKVNISPSRGITPLVVQCGDLRFSIDTAALVDMLNQLPVERDLDIARRVAAVDAKVLALLQ